MIFPEISGGALPMKSPAGPRGYVGHSKPHNTKRDSTTVLMQRQAALVRSAHLRGSHETLLGIRKKLKSWIILEPKTVRLLFE